jgi:hypothetical protein
MRKRTAVSLVDTKATGTGVLPRADSTVAANG